MSRRALLSLLLVSALAAPLPAASAAPKPKVPALTGTVKVTSAYSAVMDVRLTKRVFVGDGFDTPKGWTITGTGRLVGALLLDAKGGPTSVEMLKFGFCTTEGCAGTEPRVSYKAYDGVPPSTNEYLPAGDYRLVVITDGKPVTVVFKFPGLKGSATFKPLRRILAKHMVPDYLPPAAASPVGAAFIGSVSSEIDGGLGLLFQQFQVKTDFSAQQNAAFCIYSGSTSPEPAPGCPGGQGLDFSFTRLTTDPGTFRMWSRMRYLDEGSYRAGTYYNAVGPAHDPLGVITWVTLPPR